MTALERALWIAALGPVPLLVPGLRRRFFGMPRQREEAL